MCIRDSAKGVERAKRCEGSNPSFSATPEQIRFAPACFLPTAKKKPIAASLLLLFFQKVALGSAPVPL